MRKILASILAITMLMTTLSTCVIPASAEEVADLGAFTENFENYGAGNWLANMAEDGKTVGTAIEGMSANQWTIYGGVGTTLKGIDEIAASNASMEVVADPADASNKVLKLDAGDLATNSWFFFRRNVNEGNKIARKDIPAKKMIVKAKYRLPASYGSSTDTSMLSYNSTEKPPRHYLSDQVGANYGNTSWTMLASGSKTYGYNNNIKVQDTVPTDEWFEIKHVMDMTAHKTDDHPGDTYRGLFNGTIYTMYYPVFTEAMQTGNKINEVNSKYPQPSTTVGEAGEKIIDSFGGYKEPASNTAYKDYGDYYGAAMILSGRDGYTTDYMYMDDLEVYYVDAFAQVGDAIIEKNVDGAWYKGEIKIPFNNDLMEVVKEVEYNEARTKGTDWYRHITYTTNPTKPGEIVNKNVWNHRWIDYYYKDLFTLKDAEGNVVEGGIVDAYVEGNYLVIEPSALLDREVSYTVSASPLFMDVEGQGLNSYSKEQDIYTFDTAVDPYAHILYSFDFENNKVDGVNWIESRDGTTTNDNRYVIAEGVEEGAITVNTHASLPANHGQSITVENDPTGADNKVLALKAGYVGSGYVTQLRFNANGKIGISRATDMGKGKNLVYKAKIFIPTGFAMTESSQLVNTASEGQASANVTSGIGATMSGTFYAATTGSWGSPMARHQVGTTRGKWVEWKHVADVSEALSETHSDTVRAYVDDIMYTTTFAKSNAASEGKVFGDNAKYDHNLKIGDTVIDYLSGGKDLFTVNPYATLGATWWGSAFVINPQADTTKVDTFYLDDVEAFWIDDLTFNAVNAANFGGGKVKLNFNQVIREEVQYMTGNSSYNMNGLKKLALADLFKVVDLEGNVVENGIAAVTLSEDGKTVSIAPSAALEKGGDYRIEISPYLVDEYGQGLLNNSKATYVDLHISEEFVPFEMTSISQTEVSGFAQGRDVKVTAKFSVAVDDEAITNGIVVTNTDTDAVVARNEGWTANFGTDEEGNVDNKTIIFDFGSLPTANYEVSINENFTAVTGADLASAFNITISKANGKIVLFNETFDADGYDINGPISYTVDENWVEKATSSGLSGAQYTINDNRWHLHEIDPTNPNGDFAGVVAKESVTAVELNDNFKGNVLRLKNERATSHSNGELQIRRNLDALNGISLTTGKYAGKLLVVEMDIASVRTPADAANMENVFMMPSFNKNTIWRYSNKNEAIATLLMGNSKVRVTEFGWQGATNNDYTWNHDIHTTDDFKTAGKYRVVLDQTSAEKDHLRIYTNGNLASVTATRFAERLPGHPRTGDVIYDLGGVGYNGTAYNLPDTIYGLWCGMNRADVYIDNFTAYLVDPFAVESVEGNGNVFNTAKGAVTYTFSQPVDAETAIANNTVVLVDEAGEIVAGGIKSIGLDDAGYKMIVKLSDTLPGLTKYSIKLTTGLEDIYGNCISPKYEFKTYTPAADSGIIKNADGTVTYNYTDSKGTTHTLTTQGDCYVKSPTMMKTVIDLTTSKATSLFAEATQAVVNGSTVTTTVKFTNPEVTPMGVWCVVAVFGDYNEMLGCTAVDVTEVEASDSTDDIPVTITTNGGTVKSVRMFVWNSAEDMKPYQKAEEIK